MEESSSSKHCHRKGRKCSKPAGHKAGCDNKRQYDKFWDNSPVIVKKKLEVEISGLQSNECEIRNQIQINQDASASLNETIC